MEQCYLMPGQERCERFKDANGVPRVHYSYRSLHGAFFDCESRSLDRHPVPASVQGWFRMFTLASKLTKTANVRF